MAIAEPLAVSFSTSFSYVHPAIYMFVEQYTAQPFILLHVSSFRRPSIQRSIQRSIYGALHEPAHGVNGQLCRPCVHYPDNLPSLTVLSILAAAREEALGNEVLGCSAALFRLLGICCRFGVLFRQGMEACCLLFRAFKQGMEHCRLAARGQQPVCRLQG